MLLIVLYVVAHDVLTGLNLIVLLLGASSLELSVPRSLFNRPLSCMLLSTIAVINTSYYNVRVAGEVRGSRGVRTVHPVLCSTVILMLGRIWFLSQGIGLCLSCFLSRDDTSGSRSDSASIDVS